MKRFLITSSGVLSIPASKYNSVFTGSVNSSHINYYFRSMSTDIKRDHDEPKQDRNYSPTKMQQTHMTAADWIRRWEQNDKIIRWQLDSVHPFLVKHAPSSRQCPRVLVPLAGKTLDLFWLVERGFKV